MGPAFPTHWQRHNNITFLHFKACGMLQMIPWNLCLIRRSGSLVSEDQDVPLKCSPHTPSERGLSAADRYKRSVPLPIPVTSLFCSRSIPKTWVYAQRGNDRRPTLIGMHKHPLWADPRTGAYTKRELFDPSWPPTLENR